MKKSRRSALFRRRSTAFLFEELDDLLSLCRRLAERKYIGDSEVWKDQEGSWWLVLTENASPLTARDDLRFVREYGKMINGGDAQIYLPEHGSCICASGAIDVFARL